MVELGLVLALVAVLAALSAKVWDGWRDRVLVQRAQADLIAIAVVIDTHLADVGSLPASLSTIGRGNMLDPWGRVYRYRPLIGPSAISQARKNRSLVPINSDYDLYSVGPDGASVPPLTAQASRDDIIRANNGRFIGPVSLY